MRKLFFVLFFGAWFLGFNQEIISEDIAMTNGAIALPGTLSYPKTESPLPLVIFVHGSGNVDRNGNQEPVIKASYIQQLADSLTQKGIAFYRFDKRTATKTNLPKLKNITLLTFVDDVKLIISHFSKDNRFKSISLLGHSQGSLIGMLAINEKVHTFISLAGPSQSIDKVLVEQLSKQNKELATSAEAHLQELKKTDTIKAVNPYLVQFFAPQNQKFIKSWMHYSPEQEMQKITIPTLIIQGELDSQIHKDAPENLLVARAKSSNTDEDNIKMVTISNMNHVLKHVENEIENQASYFDSDFEIAPELVTSIANFIKKHG
ncbi:alpha/beta hydrolase [Croceivirga lutea]|uniref:alpha/beta hydrolase family protein n=1 Tax=Croceivirga lutea TaxID=1775167 RepID=UPI00163996CF|nr:alpha/beta hydrolase [Croceivirga lutea]GGG57430.1 alpha/beta hydrolase [Croceivirga lutea]